MQHKTILFIIDPYSKIIYRSSFYDFITIAIFYQYWDRKSITQDCKENAYKNQAVWDHAPEIVLCKNQSVFTVKDVEESVKIFKNKKYKKITTRSSCNYEYEIGKIKIVDSKKK